MRRCLELASRGAGFVAPNPMVGAVLVAEGKIIGEGFHEKYGEAHAEVNAVRSVAAEKKHLIESATLYVNLEPCNHFGKTPPCTKLIVENKIKKVVIGTADPNVLVNGSGIKTLRDAGIDVVCGLLEEENKLLNRFFFTYHEKKRPYITIKWAQSTDGFIAGEGNTPVHLTNSFSDHLVQKMRAEHMAIYVGGRTLLADDPRLTNRSGRGANPLRITLDTKNNFPKNLSVFNSEAATLVFNFEKNALFKTTEYIKIEGGKNVYEQIMQILFYRKINSILVEGGAETINTLVQLGLWDEMKIFTTKNKLQKGILAPGIAGKEMNKEYVSDNIINTRINL